MAIPKLRTGSKTTEVHASIKIIIEAYEKGELSTDEYLTAMFNELKPINDDLSTAINSSKAESELEGKDDLRDDKIRSIFLFVTGSIHHPNPVIRSAAESILKVLGAYGLSITAESYAVESSLIESLQNDLDEDTIQTQIGEIPGLEQLISELKELQDDFEESRLTFESQKSQQNSTQSATKIKKELLKLCNDKLVLYLNAMHVVNAPTYGSLSQTVAQIISDNNSAVKRRRAN